MMRCTGIRRFGISWSATSTPARLWPTGLPAPRAGRAFAWEITGLFLVGGMLGVTLGTWFGRRLSGARLQKVFAATIVGVAILVVGKTMT
jgi:uncharacterized membrane protein YfcA